LAENNIFKPTACSSKITGTVTCLAACDPCDLSVSSTNVIGTLKFVVTDASCLSIIFSVANTAARCKSITGETLVSSVAKLSCKSNEAPERLCTTAFESFKTTLGEVKKFL